MEGQHFTVLWVSPFLKDVDPAFVHFLSHNINFSLCGFISIVTEICLCISNSKPNKTKQNLKLSSSLATYFSLPIFSKTSLLSVSFLPFTFQSFHYSTKSFIFKVTNQLHTAKSNSYSLILILLYDSVAFNPTQPKLMTLFPGTLSSLGFHSITLSQPLSQALLLSPLFLLSF